MGGDPDNGCRGPVAAAGNVCGADGDADGTSSLLLYVKCCALGLAMVLGMLGGDPDVMLERRSSSCGLAKRCARRSPS